MTPVSYQSVKKMLAPAMAGGKRQVEREIESGVSRVYVTSKRNLAVVVRPEGSELVFVAVAGENLKASVNEFINFALSGGFKTIRFHTKHPERLKKGLAGVPISLVENRPRLIGKSEKVYRVFL